MNRHSRNDIPRGKHSRHQIPNDDFAFAERIPTQNRKTVALKNPNDPEQFDLNHYSRNTADYHNRRPSARKKVRRRILIGVGIVLAILVVFCVALGSSALNVKNQAPELMNTANALKNDLQDENSEAFVSDAKKLNSQIDSLKQEVNGPLWTIGSFIPVLGEDISAGQKLIGVASNLSNEVLLPLGDILSDHPLDTIYVDGNINGDAINALCNTLADAGPTIAESAATVESIGSVHIDQINKLTESLRGPLDTAAQFMTDNGDAFRLIPDLLGCNGERNYIILAQNYSEARSTGGLLGSAIPLKVTNGKLEFGDPVAVGNMRRAEGYPVEMTEEEKILFGGSFSNPTDINSTPDWARVSEVFSQIWTANGNSAPDGVIGIDVETFKRLVSLGANTVSLPDGSTINAADLTRILLHDAYITYGNDGTMQDAYFAMVLASCMDVIEGKLPSIGLQKVAKVVQQSVEEYRFMAWMKNTEEEALMEQLGCAGTLSDDPKTPEVGVYFFDQTWSKIDWYLQPSITVGPGTKNTDGTTSYPMTLTIANTLTTDEAAGLPPYVLGTNPAKRDTTDMLSSLYLYSPAGGTITNLDISGTGSLGLSPATHNGLEVHLGLLQLSAGQTTTITCTVTVSKEAEEPLQIRAIENAQNTAQFTVAG